MFGTFPWDRSIQTRIVVAYALVFITVLGLLVWWIGSVMYTARLEEGEHEMEVKAFLLANALEDPFSGFIQDFEELEKPATSDVSSELAHLRAFAQNYALDAEARVTILDRLGNVLTDSQFSASEIPNQSNQVEVQHALADAEQHNVRIDPMTELRTVFVAAPVHRDGRPIGVVQLSLPFESVMTSYRDIMQMLTLMSLVSVLLLIAIGIWLGHRLTLPIRRMEKAAIAIASGDLTQHVNIERFDELGALAKAFNKMVAELNAMFNQQQNFVAHASHELRTPLVNIQLRSDSLQRNSNLSEREHRYLTQISSETQRLGLLSTELLNLSTLDSQHSSHSMNGKSAIGGPQSLHNSRTANGHQGQLANLIEPEESPPLITPSELEATVKEIMSLHSLWANEASIEVTLQIANQLPSLRMKPQHLESIVRNLLDNAIKYTPVGGQVTMKLQPTESTAPDATWLQLVVSDSGIGIPEADLPHIFDRFFRVDKARSRHESNHLSHSSGAGLGLAIVRQIVTMYNGRIGVESQLNKGTTFTIELPYK